MRFEQRTTDGTDLKLSADWHEACQLFHGGKSFEAWNLATANRREGRQERRSDRRDNRQERRGNRQQRGGRGNSD